VAGTVTPDAGCPWSVMAAILASYRHWSTGDQPTARALAAGIHDDLGKALRGWYTHLAQSAELSATPVGGAR
jgi:hypothetical protein